MKIYLITPGKVLKQFSDEPLWLIEVVAEEERKKKCYLQTARISPLKLIETYEKRKRFNKEIRDNVDNIWNESSDVKDFAKRLYAARISDRFFEEAEFDAEETE